MKLLRLKIDSPFGQLAKGFEINFREPFQRESELMVAWNDFLPFCFAGRNGSGKSNVLEALSNIFYHLEGCVNVKHPTNFKSHFNASRSTPDAYEIEYYIYSSEEKHPTPVRVFISKEENENPKMTYTRYPYLGKPIEVKVVADPSSQFPSQAKKYLPDLVIGYSSGENEILSLPFLKTRLLNYDEYEQAISIDSEYDEPESSLIYIDYEMSQAVLLSNFLFQKEDALEPIKTELDVIGIKSFRMHLTVHQIKNRPALNVYKPIELFKNCATAIFEKGDKLILDFWVNDETKIAFRKNFKDIFALFRAFQVLYTLNYRSISYRVKSEVYQSQGYYTEGKIPVPERNEKVFYFEDYCIEKYDKNEQKIVSLLLKNLSDGEQQFLHTLGICLILKNKSALLLLDEPETHFNPDWRSKFISILQKSLEKGESNNLTRDVIITSHSPFIIADCFPDKVIVFEKDHDAKKNVAISAHKKGINTFGASVSIILEEVFKKTESSSEYALSKLREIMNRPLKTSEEIKQAKEDSKLLGESVEKVLLFRTLILKEREINNQNNA